MSAATEAAERIAAVLDIDPAKVGVNLRDHRITLAVPDALRLVAMLARPGDALAITPPSAVAWGGWSPAVNGADAGASSATGEQVGQ